MRPLKTDWIFTAFFLVILIVDIYSAGSALHEDWRNYSKPALAGSIIVYLLINFQKKSRSFLVLMLLGFGACLAGDVFLLNSGRDSFVAGLAAFLVAHVLFSLAFTYTTETNHEIPLLKQKPWTISLLAGYGIVIFHFISPGLGSITPHVIVYMAILLIMNVMALNRYKKVPDNSFNFGLAGALLFLLSDSLLAWNKFREPIPYPNVLVMLTYGLSLISLMHMTLTQVRSKNP